MKKNNNVSFEGLAIRQQGFGLNFNKLIRPLFLIIRIIKVQPLSGQIFIHKLS